MIFRALFNYNIALKVHPWGRKSDCQIDVDNMISQVPFSGSETLEWVKLEVEPFGSFLSRFSLPTLHKCHFSPQQSSCFCFEWKFRVYSWECVRKQHEWDQAMFGILWGPSVPSGALKHKILYTSSCYPRARNMQCQCCAGTALISPSKMLKKNKSGF